MRTLALALLMLSAPAFAQTATWPTAQQMTARVDFVMHCQLCSVSRSLLPDGATILVRPGLRVPVAAFNGVAGLGYSKAPSGRYAMTEIVEQSCRADLHSVGCEIATALWPRDYTGECLTADGKVFSSPSARP